MSARVGEVPVRPNGLGEAALAFTAENESAAVETVRAAIDAIESVQNPLSFDSPADSPTARHCADDGFAYLAYMSLGGSRLTKAPRARRARPRAAQFYPSGSVAKSKNC